MLSKGLYEAASKSGWSILELSNRAGVTAKGLEDCAVGVQAWNVVTELTGYSMFDIRLMGMGKEPTKAKR